MFDTFGIVAPSLGGPRQCPRAALTISSSAPWAGAGPFNLSVFLFLPALRIGHDSGCIAEQFLEADLSLSLSIYIYLFMTQSNPLQSLLAFLLNLNKSLHIVMITCIYVNTVAIASSVAFRFMSEQNLDIA